MQDFLPSGGKSIIDFDIYLQYTQAMKYYDDVASVQKSFNPNLAISQFVSCLSFNLQNFTSKYSKLQHSLKVEEDDLKVDLETNNKLKR